MPIGSGRLKERVTIKKPPTGRNTYGEKVDKSDFSNWTTVEAVYALVEETSSVELRLADSDAERKILRVTMRYRDDLGSDNTEMLAKYAIDRAGTWLDVRSVRNVGQNNKETTICICHETA